MYGKSVVVAVILIHILDVASAVPKESSKRTKFNDYGAPIQITSAVLSFQKSIENLRENSNPNGKYFSNGEWEAVSAEQDNQQESDLEGSMYLRFAGVVGSGHVYIPVESDDRLGKISGGILESSEW